MRLESPISGCSPCVRVSLAMPTRRAVFRLYAAAFLAIPAAACNFAISPMRQPAEFSRRQIEAQRTVLDALDLFHVMADLFEHAPDLPVSAFFQRELKPRIVRFAHRTHSCRRGLYSFAAVGRNCHPAANFRQARLRRRPATFTT